MHKRRCIKGQGVEGRTRLPHHVTPVGEKLTQHTRALIWWPLLLAPISHSSMSPQKLTVKILPRQAGVLFLPFKGKEKTQLFLELWQAFPRRMCPASHRARWYNAGGMPNPSWTSCSICCQSGAWTNQGDQAQTGRRNHWRAEGMIPIRALQALGQRP